MSKPQCQAIMELGDDHGDNVCTIQCQRGAGHWGRHREKGCYDLNGDFPFTITWKGDDSEEKTNE